MVVVAAGLAFALTRGGDTQAARPGTGAAAAAAAEQETAAVEVAGAPLAGYPANPTGPLTDVEADPAVGQRIPTVIGESFDGSKVQISPDDGAPKLIMFVAHWCPHCQKEVPLVKEWIDSGGVPDGVEIYSVSTSVSEQRPNYPPSEWLASEGWQPAVLLDDDTASAAQAFGLPGFPYFVLVDGEGRVVQRGSGEVAIADLEAALRHVVDAGSRSSTTVAG